jgi:hypothetical protein
MSLLMHAGLGRRQNRGRWAGREKRTIERSRISTGSLVDQQKMKSVRFSIGSPLDAGPAEVRAETAQIPEISFHRASSRVCAVAGGDSTPRVQLNS